LFYDIKDIASDMADSNGTYNKNVIVRNRYALGRIYLRDMMRFKNSTTKAKEMTVSDLLYISVFKDFYQSLSTGKVLIQPTCLADKTKFPLFEMDLKTITLPDGRTFLNAVKDISDNFKGTYAHDVAVESIVDFIAAYRQSKVKKQLVDIHNRFAEVFGGTTISEDMSLDIVKQHIQLLFKTINQNCKSLDDVRKAFENTNIIRLRNKHDIIAFFEEYDITTNQKGEFVINEVIMNAANLY
jgi:hypothetical protein